MTKEVMKQALEALEDLLDDTDPPPILRILRQAIAQAEQAEQEPVAYPEGDVVGPCVCGSWPGGRCLKCPRVEQPTAWVGLTDEEFEAARYWVDDQARLWKNIEAKLKELNT